MSIPLIKRQIKGKNLKLRGFLISFSAANPCEAKNTYLSLLVNLLVNDIKENLACQATVD
jgi:hypothetical protein